MVFFNIKVTVKVTRSMTLVPIERALLVEYAWHISYNLKVIAKVKVDNRQTDRQTGMHWPIIRHRSIISKCAMCEAMSVKHFYFKLVHSKQEYQ